MLIKEYENYLHSICRCDKSIKMYVGRIQNLLNNGYTETELCNSVDVLYKEHLKNGSMYDPKDHYNTSSALKKLKEFLQKTNYMSCVSPSKTVITPKKTTKITSLKPCKLPRIGYDNDGYYVTYDKKINVEKRVPELTMMLEGEYESIMGFAHGLFGNENVNRNLLNRIPVILKPECPYTVCEKGNAYIAKEVKDLIIKKGTSVTENEIKDILDNDTFIDRVFGRFVPGKEPRIEIYYRNVSSKNFDEYVKKLAMYLAHEYMYYIQYVRLNMNDSEYKQRNVIASGSMAEFFSVLYSLKRYDKVRADLSQDRYNFWQERFITPWHYAKALYFYTVNAKEMKFSDNYSDYVTHGSVAKLQETLKDIDNAYDILLNY